MIASAQVYPELLEWLTRTGPLMWICFLGAMGFWVFGMIRITHFRSTLAQFISILLPLIFLIGAASIQSYCAEDIITGNEHGLTYFSRPDRYIGYIRTLLFFGLFLTAVLLLRNYLGRSSQLKKAEQGA